MKNLYFEGKHMKKKSIGIFVCILMISTTVIPVVAITDRHSIRETSYDAEVPIWKKGDEWTYRFTEACKDYPLTYTLSGDLTFKVVDDSGDSYFLEATTRPQGTFDLGGYGLKTTILTNFIMKLKLRKADLGLESYNENLKGILKITIGRFTLPIPIQVEANLDVECDPTWVFIPFPLFDGKSGELDGTEFLHSNYYMSLFWGLIQVLGPVNYTWPYTSVPYTCSEEQITIEDKTFDGYNVTAEWMEGSRFVSIYCEEVGNVVKEIIFIPYGGGAVRYSLILELKDWSYSPKCTFGS